MPQACFKIIGLWLYLFIFSVCLSTHPSIHLPVSFPFTFLPIYISLLGNRKHNTHHIYIRFLFHTAHPHGGGQSALLNPQIEMLIASGNTLMRGC